MKRRLTERAFLAMVAVVGLVGLAGCGPMYEVQLRYDRPALYEIPEKIRILGIAEFGGQDKEDVEWGNIASDRVAAQLDTYNKQFNRYQLVDRKRLKAVLDEQDIQAAFSDSAKAVEAGKIAHVDAMIYGSANITTRDEDFTESKFDVFSRSMKQVRRTKRYVMAAINFSIDDVETSKTLTTVSVVREFDSEKDKAKDTDAGGKMARLIGIGGGDLPATDQILSGLIDECVAEFVSKISPHQIVVREALGNGKSDPVTTGNKLASAGDYGEALKLYQTGLEMKPEDYQAVFNSGVMYEALGKFAEAEQAYDKAFKMKPEEQYIAARKRVRAETAEAPSAPETPAAPTSRGAAE